ncbi:velvet factor-domain-containing protein [Phyllosticta citriasiana]|uniref:velvet factor-domain-containing protein n=1 Tax=Phyllosticta citriasiana TaxID=595635 RepID=UPI0030FDB41C
MIHPQYVDPIYNVPTPMPAGIYGQIHPHRICGVQIQHAPQGPSNHQPFKRYDENAMQNSPGRDVQPPTDDSAPSYAVDLSIRQQPKEALVMIDGKEKNRKPVDPPPIVQLTVQQAHDPHSHYMQSPYLIMICDLWDPELEKPADDKALSGTICSSLHRLKDIDNKDGAFFVFGDISIKKTGEYRLRFSLFDIHKPNAQYEYLNSVVSEKFRVVSQKEFRGLDESTYLSRAFSDQGVRLRLRKEPRNRKRSPPQQSFDQSNPYQTSSAPPSATAAQTPQFSYQSNARSPQQTGYDTSYPPPTPNTTTSHTAQYGGYQTPNPYADHADAPPTKRQRYSSSSGGSLAVQPPSHSGHWPGGDFNYGYSTSNTAPSSNMRGGISTAASSAAALAAATMGSSGAGGFQSGGRLPVQGSMQGQSPEQTLALPRNTDFNFGGTQSLESSQMMYFGHHDPSGYNPGTRSAGSSTGRRD